MGGGQVWCAALATAGVDMAFVKLEGGSNKEMYRVGVESLIVGVREPLAPPPALHALLVHWESLCLQVLVL